MFLTQYYFDLVLLLLLDKTLLLLKDELKGRPNILLGIVKYLHINEK